jgi:hypothetical protein
MMQGLIACSEPLLVGGTARFGIACQPQALLCLRAEAVEDKKPAN